VLHRDVKPANVLICADGRCVLTDFGVARMPSESNLTQPGMVLGSPHFISPERAIGAAFGPPSDLFSLGVTLYTAVEGRPPFDKGDPFETMRAIVEDQPAPPVRAGALAPVLMGLLEKDPARRWTVAQARSALRELSGTALGGRAASPTLPAQARPPVALAPASDAAPIAAASASASPPPAALSAAPVPPRQLGGRNLPADSENPPTTLDAYQGGNAVVPRVGSVFDETRAHTVPPVGTYSDVTYDGLPPVAGAGRGGSAGRAWSTVRRWPRALQLGLAAGAAALVIVLIVVIAMSAGGPSTTPQNIAGSAPAKTAAKPSFPVRSFHDRRGIVVNVPASWHKASTSNYTDFTDPDRSARKLRINVENSGKDSPQQFLQVAERGLENPRECTSPYSRINLTDSTLAGHSGAILEYTCGVGTGKRHGIWAATTISGHAYEFYLTVPDSDFAASKPIFDEMVNSFHLTAPAV
jgi:hypothetical protein